MDPIKFFLAPNIRVKISPLALSFIRSLRTEIKRNEKVDHSDNSEMNVQQFLNSSYKHIVKSMRLAKQPKFI